MNVQFDDRHIHPGKIVCVGRNYVEHIRELGNEIPENMVIFLKPSTAISETLLSEHNGETLHYEGEISFLYMYGKFQAVSFGLDLTKRALQNKLKNKGLPWERTKAFDGAALFSPFVSFEGSFDALSLSLEINDKRTQSGSPELMMYKPDKILKEIESFMTLEDGDIVMTGTPKGVGEIQKGDTFRGSIYLNGSVVTEKTWKAL